MRGIREDGFGRHDFVLRTFDVYDEILITHVLSIVPILCSSSLLSPNSTEHCIHFDIKHECSVLH